MLAKTNKHNLPPMPLPPETLSGVMPRLIPPIQYENSIISNFFHNWKVGQIERETERRAKIAQNNHAETSARLQMMTEIITWQAKTQDVFQLYFHLEEMRSRERAIKDEELNKIRLENYLLQIDAKKAEFEFKQMLKENGDDNET
jgi:hypothetical protein